MIGLGGKASEVLASGNQVRTAIFLNLEFMLTGIPLSRTTRP